MPLFFVNDHGALGQVPPPACDYRDIGAALAEANHTARAVIARRLRQSPPDFSGSIDIEDEEHRLVARIPLAELAHRLARAR